MLGKCVLLVFVLTISLTGIIGTQRYEDLKISVVTTNLDANAVADDDGLVILHHGRPDVKGIIHYTLGNRSGGEFIRQIIQLSWPAIRNWKKKSKFSSRLALISIR